MDVVRRESVGRRAYLLALSLILTCAAMPSAPGARAHAQASDGGEPEGYRETVAEAVREFEASHFEESRSLFARAHALYPNARTHRGLGFAEFELRNYGASIAQLTAALRARIKPLTSELIAETEHVLARANSFVARVRVDAKPGSAQVLVDGLRVDTPARDPLLLQVGDHVLEFGAPGFLSEKRRVSVKGGEAFTLTVVLAPQSAPQVQGPTVHTAARPSAGDRRWYKNPWLWTSVGVLALGAAAGGAGYALTRPAKAPPPYRGTAGLDLEGP